jgi:SAM-dependent methyltransferase
LADDPEQNLILSQAEWIADELSLTRRSYSNYEEYVSHQKSKLSKIDLTQYDVKYRQILTERLQKLDLLKRGDNVLCIAARLGTECKSFIDLGCFPIGIDLNPGPENHYVVHGDFHQIQFADESIDYVFTNALDHVFELDKVIHEIRRVLKPTGTFIAEIVGGSLDDHGRDPGLYESMWWGNVDDLINKIIQFDFKVKHRSPFIYPWEGYQVVFQKCG